MSEKRGALEDVYRAVLQDPCDRVRAALPEPQSPAVELHTRRVPRLDCGAIMSVPINFRGASSFA